MIRCCTVADSYCWLIVLEIHFPSHIKVGQKETEKKEIENKQKSSAGLFFILNPVEPSKGSKSEKITETLSLIKIRLYFTGFSVYPSYTWILAAFFWPRPEAASQSELLFAINFTQICIKLGNMKVTDVNSLSACI